ncbi:MAG: LysR family transcriptional regulator [Clostridia bacterium]|nr:LysR family transcriptional regulator [Clostridia bacterium]
MPRRNSDTLYYLSVLAEEQNMTRAADRLYISQPALTAFLNRLEADLNVRLFDRSAVPIRLTDAGRYFITNMQRIEVMKNQLMDDLRSMDQSIQRILRIGIGRNRGAMLMPETLKRLNAQLPDLRIRLYEDRDINMVESIHHGMLDVAVLETFAYIGELPYTMIGQEQHCFITSYDHPDFAHLERDGNAPDHPIDADVSLLNQQNFLCPNVRSSLNDFTQWLFSNYRVRPRDIIFVSNNVTAYQLALKNLGCAFLNTRYADLIRTKERPLYIMPGGHPVYRRLYAVYPSSEPLPEVAALIRCMTEVLAAG